MCYFNVVFVQMTVKPWDSLKLSSSFATPLKWPSIHSRTKPPTLPLSFLFATVTPLFVHFSVVPGHVTRAPPNARVCVPSCSLMHATAVAHCLRWRLPTAVARACAVAARLPPGEVGWDLKATGRWGGLASGRPDEIQGLCRILT
jgi:hypothetical protein